MPTKEGECQPKLKRKKRKRKEKGPPQKKLFGGGNFYGNLPNGSLKGGDKNWRNYPKKNKNQYEMLFFISGELIGGDTQMRGVGVREG